MSQTRIYGSDRGGFGAAAAAWTAVGFGQFSAGCSDLVTDIQGPTDGCYVYRVLNPSNHYCTYTVPDTAIPDNAIVTLAEWGVRYQDTCGIPTLARPCIDTTQVSAGWPAQCFPFTGDTTRSTALGQTGATTKAQTWGFVSATEGGGDVVYFSALSIRFTFTLPLPTVTTNAASAITSTTATLNGTFNPNTATTQYPASYFFQWGLTTSYGNNTTIVGNQTGSSNSSPSANLSSLAPSTLYHFRLVGRTADGDTFGSDQSFTTNSSDKVLFAL